jgi:hypothetical protein
VPEDLEFNLAAISRDLIRRPEIKHLAKVLAMLGPTGPVTEDIPPIYIYQAYRLIEKPELAEILKTTIEICKK